MREYFGKVLALCRIQIRDIVFSWRWGAVSLLTLSLLLFYLNGILAYARDHELNISPVVVPFLFADSTFGLLGMVILIFLMSIFPIRSRHQWNLRMRGGNSAYSAACLLTMVGITVLWLVELQVLSMLIIGNRCLFGGWGKVWGSVQTGMVSELGYDVRADISMNIILEYRPWQALLTGMLVVILTCIIFSEIIILLDLLSNKNIGEIILTLWCMVCVAIGGFSVPWAQRVVRVINPTSWLNISGYLTYPEFFQRTLIQMAVLIAVAGIGDYILLKYKAVDDSGYP